LSCELDDQDRVFRGQTDKNYKANLRQDVDIALPLFESEDVKLALPASVELFRAGKPRPPFPFKGR
jgi:hypothetical protein